MTHTSITTSFMPIPFDALSSVLGELCERFGARGYQRDIDPRSATRA